MTSALEGETFDKEQVAKLNRIGSSLVDLCTDPERDGETDYKIWELMEPMESGERLYLWQWLQTQSKVRTRVKEVCLKNEHAKAKA